MIDDDSWIVWVFKVKEIDFYVPGHVEIESIIIFDRNRATFSEKFKLQIFQKIYIHN